MMAGQYDFDAIQDQQDYYLLQRMNQGSEPEEPKSDYDFYCDRIDEGEETFDTPDGVVAMHNLVEYVRGFIDERVTGLDMAIETIASVMEEQI